jgi:hypothetical protein
MAVSKIVDFVTRIFIFHELTVYNKRSVLFYEVVGCLLKLVEKNVVVVQVCRDESTCTFAHAHFLLCIAELCVGDYRKLSRRGRFFL